MYDEDLSGFPNYIYVSCLYMFAVKLCHVCSLFGRPAMALLAKRSVPETKTSAVWNMGLYMTECQNVARNSRCVAMGVATLICLSVKSVGDSSLHPSAC